MIIGKEKESGLKRYGEEQRGWSPTGFPHSFPQNVNKGGEKWGKVV